MKCFRYCITSHLPSHPYGLGFWRFANLRVFCILWISLAPPPHFLKTKLHAWFVKEYLYHFKVLLQGAIISDKIPKRNAACLICKRISVLCFITGCNIFGQNPKVQKTRMYGRSLRSFTCGGGALNNLRI